MLFRGTPRSHGERDVAGRAAFRLPEHPPWRRVRVESKSIRTPMRFCKLLDVRAKRKLFVGALGSDQLEAAMAEIETVEALVEQHELVPPGEEMGVILCGYKPEVVVGWVLTKGAKFERVPLDRRALTIVTRCHDFVMRVCTRAGCSQRSPRRVDNRRSPGRHEPPERAAPDLDRGDRTPTLSRHPHPPRREGKPS